MEKHYFSGKDYKQYNAEAENLALQHLKNHVINIFNTQSDVECQVIFFTKYWRKNELCIAHLSVKNEKEELEQRDLAIKERSWYGGNRPEKSDVYYYLFYKLGKIAEEKGLIKLNKKLKTNSSDCFYQLTIRKNLRSIAIFGYDNEHVLEVEIF
jgi:hypothetical protein